jgi:hypothetical protein
LRPLQLGLEVELAKRPVKGISIAAARIEEIQAKTKRQPFQRSIRAMERDLGARTVARLAEWLDAYKVRTLDGKTITLAWARQASGRCS